jgi:Protein of unknown function (DUF2628)
MPIYTVHEPPEKRRESRRGPDRFQFVRDGFHFWAFLLPPFWMLRRKLLLVLLGYLVLAALIGFGMRALNAAPSAVLAAELLLSLLVALEAGTLRRWTLRRRGWRELGTVVADDHEEAERRFFYRWAEDVAGDYVPPRPSPAPYGSAPRASGSDVLGLFPEAGTPR